MRRVSPHMDSPLMRELMEVIEGVGERFGVEVQFATPQVSSGALFIMSRDPTGWPSPIWESHLVLLMPLDYPELRITARLRVHIDPLIKAKSLGQLLEAMTLEVGNFGEAGSWGTLLKEVQRT